MSIKLIMVVEEKLEEQERALTRRDSGHSRPEGLGPGYAGVAQTLGYANAV
ncbi:MAG: hypothetical protein KBD21_05575 [Candidatus Pacebacteria bacterium]|nr:hypothetical protein [Candidatus Paceibacterota bacterium]